MSTPAGTSPHLSPSPVGWRVSERATIELDRPRVMGILNVTPDSFADGGRYATPDAAAEAALAMVRDGADLIDIGAESTRPGAARVPAAAQIARARPVIHAIRAAGSCVPLTIDTTLAEVARAALDAGADAINDVSAGTEDVEMLALAASRGTGVILMHRLTDPTRDRYSDRYAEPPVYADVVEDVAAFVRARADAARAVGVAPESIVIDPGLGFGKSVAQNLRLIAGTPRLAALGYPVLSALSRKSFVGRVSLGRDSDPSERLEGTLALSVAHLHAGARLFRVHDVAAHVRALRAAWAVMHRSAPV